MKRFCTLLVSACCVTACGDEPQSDGLQQEKVTVVRAGDIDENSGIAPSFLTENAVWTHHDSGGTPVIYLISLEDGSLLATIALEGSINQDWEDITSFKKNGISYLAIGDVGDNFEKRREYQICILREPSLSPGLPAPQGFVVTRDNWVDLRFRYEDSAHNCEALAYDPKLDRFLLLTKKVRGNAGLYELAIPETDVEGPSVAEKIAEVNIQNVSAMDLSRSGESLFVRAYGIGHFFSIPVDTDWKSIFADPLPKSHLLPKQLQGEGACFLPGTDSVLLSTEKRNQPIFRVWIE
ncbi:MAG: hypothetical protein AAGF67_11700 [Verrucomicrobiota bacterium]